MADWDTFCVRFDLDILVDFGICETKMWNSSNLLWLLQLASAAVLLVVVVVDCGPFIPNADIAGFDLPELPQVTAEPDACLDFVQLVRSRFGKWFEVETHEVETDDGYILVVHRLVALRPKKSAGDTRKTNGPHAGARPILLQHGFLGSSIDWILNSPFLHSKNETDTDSLGDNLAFDLALDPSYDVWLSNSRGNNYSNRHRRFTPKQDEFWQFSFDEMALSDLPAVIHYVLAQTNQTNLGYVGFSQGTTIMFALLASEPKYAQIVQPFVALAPVAYVGNVRTPLRYFCRAGPALRYLGGQFEASSYWLNVVTRFVCGSDPLSLCSNALFLLSGFDRKHLNETRLPVYFGHVPSPTSNWDLAHWCQGVESKQFRRFDYGTDSENKAHYGQKSPPDWPLSNISPKAQIALFSGQNDYLASPKDVDLLRHLLTKQNKVQLIEDYVVPEPAWSHIDFVFGEGAGKLVYRRVMDVLARFSGST